MVKYLVIIKSHFLAFPLSWRWRLLNLRSSHVLQYTGLVTPIFFHQDQNSLFCFVRLEGHPVFQLRNPFPYLQVRVAEIVQSSLSSTPYPSNLCATCWLAPWISQLDHHFLVLKTEQEIVL